MPSNWMRQLCLDAAEAGYSFEVISADDQIVEYKGDQPLKAFKAAEDVEMAHVRLHKEGERMEVALYVRDVGPGEEVADYSCFRDRPGWIEQWWDRMMATEAEDA